MAILTGGTTSTSVLSGLLWTPQSAQADIAQFNANIKRQYASVSARPSANDPSGGRFPTGLLNGVIDFPDRVNSQITLIPGDYVFYDSWGWPIVISGASITASGGTSSWAHS